MKLEITYLPLEQLTPYKNNAKQHPQEQIDEIKASIIEFSMNDPIAICGNENIIVEGHGRLIACQQLGIKTVPVIRLDHLTEDQRKAYTLAHNKLTMNTGFDLEILKLELLDINLDMSEFGFSVEMGEIDLHDNDEIVEDEAPEPPAEPQAKLGDIYQLGEHILMCGDSTDAGSVAILMNGEKADMVFTDPPYLMGFTGNVHGDGSRSFNAKYGEILNDKMSKEDGDKFILAMFNVLESFVEGAFYVCFYRLGLDYIFRALDYKGIDYKALIIWNKGNHTLSNSDYMSKYEPIVYGWFNKHEFFGDRSNFDIWDLQRTQKNDLHPTMKPIALCAKAINNSSLRNGKVLDLFGGSGSTLIACEQLGRKCYMMELEPKYVDVIIGRWENLTGRKAEKVN